VTFLKTHWGKLLILVLVVALAGGFYVRKRRAKDAAKPEDDATVAAVSRGALEIRFTETGEIAAKNSVDVASKVSGRVIKLSVQEGSKVGAGQELAVIQPGRSETEKYLPSPVLAPIAGIVMRYVKETSGGSTTTSDLAKIGDYVTGLFDSTNPTYLLTVADLRELIVRMRISEMDVLKLKEKMPVTVTVDALPSSTVAAHVSLISPQAEKDSSGLKVFRVEVSLDKPDPRLKPGMTARVDALLEKKDSVIKMPLAALFEEAGETFAFVQSLLKKSRKTIVRAGLRTELEVEVAEGLKEGEKVLLEKPKDADLDKEAEIGKKGRSVLRRAGAG
jgi:HlyD family secretion protein